jgi:hypothetical protein
MNGMNDGHVCMIITMVTITTSITITASSR